jgi:hypothetical protein
MPQAPFPMPKSLNPVMDYNFDTYSCKFVLIRGSFFFSSQVIFSVGCQPNKKTGYCENRDGQDKGRLIAVGFVRLFHIYRFSTHYFHRWDGMHAIRHIYFRILQAFENSAFNSTFLCVIIHNTETTHLKQVLAENDWYNNS